MNSVRLTSTLGAGAVAAIAAWSSWSHMVGVALRVGESPSVAYALPLSVDGLLVVASAAMVDDKRSGRRPRLSARVAFAVGVAASLAANIAHAHPTTGARIVAGWPALALLLVVELLSRSGRKVAASEPVSDVKTEPSEPATTPAARPARKAVAPKPATPRKSARTATKVAQTAARMPGATRTEIAARAGVSEPTVRRYLTSEQPAVNGAAVLDEVLS